MKKPIFSNRIKKYSKGWKTIAKYIQKSILYWCYDDTHTIAIFEEIEKTSQPKTLKIFFNHIKPESHLIHDKEKSHKILIKKLILI